MKKFIGASAWGLMLFLALAITLISSRYLTLDPDVYFPEQRAVYLAHTLGIVSHIAGALVALALGPFQFLPRLRRKRWLNVHRWLGRLYLTAVAVGGLGGFYMAWLAYGGPITQLGFALLALFWLSSGALAYRTIRAGNVQAHRRWMMRNYAATFAAVTLRLWLPLLQVGGVEFLTAYRMVAWISWIPNLLIMEWWLRSQTSMTTRRKPQTAIA